MEVASGSFETDFIVIMLHCMFSLSEMFIQNWTSIFLRQCTWELSKLESVASISLEKKVYHIVNKIVCSICIISRTIEEFKKKNREGQIDDTPVGNY